VDVTAGNRFREHTKQLAMVPPCVNHPRLVHLSKNCHVLVSDPLLNKLDSQLNRQNRLCG